MIIFQEIFHEHATHLRILYDHQNSNVLIESAVPARLQNILMRNYSNGCRHAPYFICGTHGTGKSALITELYNEVMKWFPENIRIYRVIRFASATSRSAYNLELLRVICQQLSIIYNIPEGYLPKDASFDPLYINNWFQNLLKRIEDMNRNVLFLFIDDLHILNPLDCDSVAALSWLPTSLPWNVQLICSSTLPIDNLKLTIVQKERFKSIDYLYDLTKLINKTTIKKLTPIINPASMTLSINTNSTNSSNTLVQNRIDKNLLIEMDFIDFLESQFDHFEYNYGYLGFSLLASYLTLSEYGLTEIELLELLMPIDDPAALLSTQNGHFSFSTFKKIHLEMGKYFIPFLNVITKLFFVVIFLTCYIFLILTYFK